MLESQDKQSKVKKDYQDYRVNKEDLGSQENLVRKVPQACQDFLELPEEKESLVCQEYQVIGENQVLKEERVFQEGTETKEIKEKLDLLDLEDLREMTVCLVDLGFRDLKGLLENLEEMVLLVFRVRKETLDLRVMQDYLDNLEEKEKKETAVTQGHLVKMECKAHPVRQVVQVCQG